MKRKIIKQGAGGFTIYLPKKWVLLNNLSEGDYINLEIEDNNIIISPTEKPKKQKRIEITLAGELKYKSRAHNPIKTIIAGLYIAGYDEIIINFEDEAVFYYIERGLQQLTGAEVFRLGKGRCSINIILDETEVDIDAYFRKILSNIYVIQDLIKEYVNNNTPKILGEVKFYRRNILNQRDLILRCINKNQFINEKLLAYNILTITLWNITRNYSYLVDYMINHKASIDEKSRQFLEKTNNFFRKFFSSLKKHDFIKKRRLYDALIEEGLNLNQDSKVNSNIITYCISILMLIESCNAPLYLLTLNP